MRNKKNIEKNAVILLSKGVEKGFDFIFYKYYGRIYNFVLNTLYDRVFAEDITQSVFITLWENRTNINPEKNIENYLYTIAKHKVYRQTERLILQSKHREYVKENTAHTDNIEEAINKDFLEKLLYEFIDELPKSRRDIFIMSRKDELTNKEIAETLLISEKTVETQIRRAVMFLREKMGHYLTMFLMI